MMFIKQLLLILETMLLKFLEKNMGEWKSTAFGQMLERRMHSGATEEQILDLIENDPTAPKELKELYETIKTQYF